MTKKITSAQNPGIKNLASLITKASQRRKTGMFVVEGPRELRRAGSNHFDIHEVYFCPNIVSEDDLEFLENLRSETTLIEVNQHVFSKIAYRKESGGMVGVLKQKKHSLNTITLPQHALVLVLENVEKPGNLGAVLRTADAAGVDAVILGDAGTDIYNPNVIRSSTGTVFSMPIAMAESEAVIDYLHSNGISIFSATLEGSIPYTKADFTKACAIVLGTEAHGLTEVWTRNSDQNIIIPMQGTADSLNVSITAAVMTFEAIRQRDK